jgi:hypothetical protein
MLFHLTLKSRNAKVGKIPVSTSSRATCPPACGMYEKGCYAMGGPLAIHWRKVSEGFVGTDYLAFVSQIALLSDGQPWRHNQAGDLPGDGNTIDADMLALLVDANRGKMGWTYTHKPMSVPANREAVRHANANGFAINLSADTLAQADTLADMAIAPVVVVLDAADGTKADTVTPAGRRVVTCPATYMDKVTCESCLLCARINRPTIVGFPAHGTFKKSAAAMARGGA